MLFGIIFNKCGIENCAIFYKPVENLGDDEQFIPSKHRCKLP